MPKRDSLVKGVIKEEKPEVQTTKEELKKIKDLLKKQDSYSDNYILKILHDKESLRKVFLAVVKEDPAKISDICEFTLFHKQNCYPLLNQLLSLGLVRRVYVNDIMNGNSNEEDKEVQTKFLEWTAKMPENTKRYFLAKTSYWRVTKFGVAFVGRAYKFNQEFKK